MFPHEFFMDQKMAKAFDIPGFFPRSKIYAPILLSLYPRSAENEGEIRPVQTNVKEKVNFSSDVACGFAGRKCVIKVRFLYRSHFSVKALSTGPKSNGNLTLTDIR